MKIKPTRINKRDLIKTRDIPSGTSTCAMVSYMGRTILVPVEYLENGQYRLEFIRQCGIPLPPTRIPQKLEEYFIPNLSVVIE